MVLRHFQQYFNYIMVVSFITENIVFVLSTFILWEKNWQLIGTTFHLTVGAIWSWLYGSWSYNYLCNQYLSPLKVIIMINPSFQKNKREITLPYLSSENEMGSGKYSDIHYWSSMFLVKTNYSKISLFTVYNSL
jgi:hypothetical protein